MNKLTGAILACTFLIAGAATASVTPYFSPSSTVKTTIVKSIKSAETSIDVAMYSFSDKTILRTLKDAAKSGVQVRLILNKAKSVKEKAEDLEAAGIDVRYVSVTMHHKFAIIDGPISNEVDPDDSTLLTGSGNWSSSSSTSYDEDLLVFKNEGEYTSAYQTEFNHLWDNSREFGLAYDYDLASISTILPTVKFTSSNMVPTISSLGNPGFKTVVDYQDGVAGIAIIDAIDSAEGSIKIATAHFRRADISFALERALDRGVEIKVVLDQQEYHSRGSSSEPTYLDETLASSGATVRYKMYSRYWDFRTAKQMHAKYMIVDDSKVVTGSFNWSRNAEIKVMENLLVLENARIASKYIKNFYKIFNYGEGSLKELKKKVEKAGGEGPCAFKPISLTGRQINGLRGSYDHRACR